MADETSWVNTEFGPLEVPVELLNVWNKYGWPRESSLQDMVEAQDPDA